MLARIRNWFVKPVDNLFDDKPELVQQIELGLRENEHELVRRVRSGEKWRLLKIEVRDKAKEQALNYLNSIVTRTDPRSYRMNSKGLNCLFEGILIIWAEEPVYKSKVSLILLVDNVVEL